MGLTRGGVVTALEVARGLEIPLEPLVIKKIGAPQNPELAIGAVGPNGITIWNEDLCLKLNVDQKYKDEALKVKAKERDEKENFFRQGRPARDLNGKIVILVDDGIATGTTVEVAINWIKTQTPDKIILGVPIAPTDVIAKLKTRVDELICLKVEPEFRAVGQFYEEFNQVSDENTLELLKRAKDNLTL